jgi:hypothetical protein
MSLANFIQQGQFFTPPQVSTTETIKNLKIGDDEHSILHTIDQNDNYYISSPSGTNLMFFDADHELLDCKLKDHINTQIQPVSQAVSNHQNLLNTHDDAISDINDALLSLGENSFSSSGTATADSSTLILNSVISNNTISIFQGSVLTNTSSMFFKVFIRNTDNNIELINWMYDGFISNSDNLTFLISSGSLNISFSNSSNSNSPYKLNYMKINQNI